MGGLTDILAKLMPQKTASEVAPTRKEEPAAQAAAYNIKYHRYLNVCSFVGVMQPFSMDQWVSAGQPETPKEVAAAHGVTGSY